VGEQAPQRQAHGVGPDARLVRAVDRGAENVDRQFDDDSVVPIRAR
jgi:hypothetical protein